MAPILWESTPHHIMKSFLLSDWGAPIESAVRSVAAMAAVCYVFGMMTGAWLHRLNDDLAAAVSPKPPVPVILQRQAVPSPRNVAAPDPMAMAIAAVHSGTRVATAARMFSVSRTTLRRRLAK